ncbi:MAG TPA: hypothetical protein VH558_03570 [Pseudolabrys sp.]
MELSIGRRRWPRMSTPEIAVHIVILVLAGLGILVSLAGMVFWWVSRKKMKRLT